MVGEFSAADDIMAGGLYARAVEPRAGETSAAPAAPLCLNCGTALAGEFCHACGQNGHVHKTLGSIGHDLLHGVFHFEGKIWRTLPMLALRPGALTRRYIAGERARFVSPLAVFLFAVFLMFAVLGSLPNWRLVNTDLFAGGDGGLARAQTELANARKQAAADVAEARHDLAGERAHPGADPSRMDRLRDRLGEAEDDQAAVAKAERLLPGADPAATRTRAETASSNWLDAKWRHAKENPQLLIYKLKNSAYKYSWALIPISLPFIWLLFPLRRDVGLYDHAIFATYSLTFMSLLVIGLAVLGALGVPSPLLSLAGSLLPPIHLYAQLKGAYGLGRWAALWRLGWLLLFTLLSVSFFALMLIYLGLTE